MVLWVRPISLLFDDLPWHILLGMKSSIGRLLIALFCLIALFLGATGSLSVLGMTAPQQIAFSMLIIAATLWISEAVPLFVTSLLVLFMSLVWLLPEISHSAIVDPEMEELVESSVSAATFRSPFFSDIILLFLGGFVISTALEEHRLDEQLAGFILSWTGCYVPWLMVGVMSVTAFLSMWMSNTATAAMMTALILPVIGHLPAGDPSRKAIVLSVPFAANIGGLGTPIGSPPNAIGISYMRQIDVDPSFLEWMLIAIPGVLGMLLFAWVLLNLLYRGSSIPEEAIQQRRANYKWTPTTYFVVITTLITAIGWMTGELHGYSSGIVGLIPVIVFFATRTISAKKFRELPWDVLMLMGGGLCLGTCVMESGLDNWIVSRLPLEGASTYVLMVMFGCAAIIMASLMSHTATANLILVIAMGLSVEPISPILIGVVFACSLAMPLPISTPPNAIAFSSGEISVIDLLVPGLIITATGLFLAYTVGYWWWGFVGVI
ncbi:SLC13 family permease [Calycomorphotria hydatis]|uniref:Sodium-dependent dicarboxylate transporter SdcS n=1 Tax=Calycomorphotria hydatis TaxID=2528027 RepID=A0A517TAV7_9PLAN|nr:DASS family sodium-coupled anion symporter [Calycomorphotria hydatis]QDT65503.1 Sodium-dependent dicarboxylate transporter SdcS [Calycomorphotria hydatis]